MILGGLKEGVTPLDMAHAYETFATGGRKVYNPKLGAPDQGPTGIQRISCPTCRQKVITDKPTYKQVLPPAVAATVQQVLEGVVQNPGIVSFTAVCPPARTPPRRAASRWPRAISAICSGTLSGSSAHSGPWWRRAAPRSGRRRAARLHRPDWCGFW